jgi:methylenetetrahydrofolate reductase (NADPH)
VETVGRMASGGLENLLMVTGDRLKQEPPGRRARYLESVPAIQAAKRLNPRLFVAAALNPFKYREEDAMAQYLKLGKKVLAGADCIVTQIGFDMRKYEEALFWIDARNYRVPLVANVMPMSAARARFIRRHQLAGVTVTDSFLALLEAEEKLLPDKGAARSLRRLALQIIGLRLHGYAGIQLTGVHAAERLAALRGQVDALSDLCADRIAWARAWEESFTIPEGGRADPVPGSDPWYMSSPRARQAGTAERWKYRAMRAVHRFAFDQGVAARIAAPLLGRIRRGSAADALLVRVERSVKAGLFGCETCGACRLAATQYVCPETCPKGLANGPCGGTTDNLCEFRDRECIHSVKYRIAKDAGTLDQLEYALIPSVPPALRNTSSWPPHFRAEGIDGARNPAGAAANPALPLAFARVPSKPA